MARRLRALLIGFCIVTAGYLVLGYIGYSNIAAYQYPSVPMNEATSFPPWYAFVVGGYLAALAFVPVTLVAWLGLSTVSVLRRAKREAKI